MTRAVRMAMAASLAALALGASGGAFAANCKAPTAELMPCTSAALDAAPVLDLTLVHDAAAPAGHSAFVMPLAISESGVGDVVIDNADPISESDFPYSATAISGYSSAGSVDITNEATGDLEALSYFGDATGIEGYAYGDVRIDNAADINVYSAFGNAIGIYGYSLTGDTSIDNSGDITAFTYYGLADGIFASGTNVDVSNNGDITATNVYGNWAAGIEAQGTDLTQVSNDGSIQASAAYGYAYGIYATGDMVDVSNTGSINAQGSVATGIEAQGGSSVDITNDGDITAGGIFSYYNPYTYTTYLYGSTLATGINATANYEGGAVTVTNNGDVSAVGYYGGTGIAANATGTGGSASVTNSGSVYASQYSKYGYGAYGIVASADGDATIDNTAGGSITVYSPGSVTGAAALSFAGNASVTNAGDISVENTALLYYGAYGIVSFGQNGTAYAGNSGSIDVTTKYNGVGIDASGLEGATVDNSGDIAVDAWRAYGIRANSGAGDVSVDNSGSIYSTYTAGLFDGTAFGILATSTLGDVSVDNSGGIATVVTGQSVGIFGRSAYGNVDIANSGDIYAYSYANYAVGTFARADYGTASVDNSGSISANAYYGYAFGVLARGGYADVSNSGDIAANGFYSATGIAASSYYGTTVDNTGGSISASALGQATGISATSFYGNASVSNGSDIQAVGLVYGATGINTYAYGDVEIDNSGDIYAGSLYGNAIGLYGYSIAGNTSIGNSGDITAVSYYGLADGIFASGANVDVANSGALQTYGYTWSAGIEAQGADGTMVSNSGDITAYSSSFVQVVDYYGNLIGYAAGGDAYGIYATAGDGGLAIDNSGNMMVDGGYATGIEAQSSGDIAITNSGDIVAGSGYGSYYNAYTGYSYYYGTQLANGINATSNGAGAAVSVTSSGDISASGIFGANGIAATSGGEGGTASVDNSGSIYVMQDQKYGYGAYGIVTSADGDSSITNSGSIGVYSGGIANGATALSFAGDASVTNSGDIYVNSTAGKYYAASGIVSFAQNGAAYADNSGSVSAIGKYTATAINAAGFTGATVVNSGSLYANGGSGAYGVYAISGTGDVSVSNTETGSIDAYSYNSRAFGVLGIAIQGDVMVDNAGSIEVYGYGQSAGIFGYSGAGNVSVSNSGDITAITGGNTAVGIFARADNGTASVDNSGDIAASVQGVNGFIGNSAYGVLARGAYAEVSNSGNIDVFGLYYGTGIAASSYYGSTVTTTGGSIYVYAVGGATGIDAQAPFGDVNVDNASDITALGLYYGATGIHAYSVYGDSHVANSGDIYAGSIYGTATGIYAVGEGSSVDNSGSITAAVSGDIARATGVINAALYTGDATTTNSGDIHAIANGGVAPYGVYEAQAVGVYNLALLYDSMVDNSGGISAAAYAMEAPVDLSSFFTAKAIGVQAVNVYGLGAASINNSGDILATAATTQGFASAWGALSQGLGLYGDASINNDGLISSYSYAGIGSANSIAAYAKAVDGDVSITNHGDISSIAHTERGVVYYAVDYSYATGVNLLSPSYYGAGSATLDNFGSITATAFSDGGITGARGVQAYAAHTSITNHAGATISATGEVGTFGGGFASGIEATGKYAVDVTNDGDIEVHGIAHGYVDGTHTFYGASRASGVVARANYQGNVSVTNNGDINAIATSDNGITFFNAGAGATGVTAYGKYDATVTNAGDINAVATSELGIVGAYGVQVHGKYTGNLVNMAGATIYAHSSVGSLSTDAYGGRAVAFGSHTYGSDYATTTNWGVIDAQAIVTDDGGANDSISLASTWGASIGAYSTSRTGTIVNHGDILAVAGADFGSAKSYGTYINSQYMADTSNDGLISSKAMADGGDAFAVGTISNALHSVYYVPCDNYGCDYSNASFTPDDGVASLANSGDIVASATAAGGVGNSYAAVVRGGFGSTLDNSGHIMASTEAGDAQATAALLVSFYGASSIDNSGLIQAMAEGDHASATGAGAVGLDGGAYIGNSGQIIAAAYGADATATAVRMESNSTNKLVNTGSITALGDGERIAISSEGNAMADLLNSGTIIGSIQTGDLDDRFVNASGGKWYPIGSSNFGAGNDVIINNAGGLIYMDGNEIHMGSGPANSFLNLGSIVSMGDNLIDMGAGNTGAFTNVNWVNFIDGATDDSLTVTGNFGGTGALDLDVDLAGHSSDQIQVNGNMVANAAQHVDILFDGMPLIAHTSIDFAHVTGTSAAGNFVPGQVLNYNYPRNFIDLQFGIGSNINTANSSPDVFSIDLDVAGLLDSGTIAANVASGAAGMLNAQVGTLRQRLGVNPYGDPSKVMSAFVRFYSNEGDVTPDHVAANFGQGGNFGYNLNTWGREVGVNANLFTGFHAGVTIGTANGRQRLTGAGNGQNRMDGMTWGAYATWYAPQGFYVDLSGRWMAVDVDSTSAAGVLQSRAHTAATNLEAGYPWTTSGGLVITPQLQYTRTKVDGIRTLYGDRANFEGHGGTSSRGRVGVEFSKTFQTSGGMNIVPYGSLNAIREFDGEMTYTVADNFYGATSTGGTSSMAELGIGLEKGKFAVSAGANWVDGGAFNSVLGGQLVVRFAW